jgi:hypothetical protein
MPRRYHRDPKGRFATVKPKPPLLDPELVRSLGVDRRPEIIFTADHELTVTIWRPKVAADERR